LACVPAHLLGNHQEFTHEPELLTEAALRPLRVNVTAPNRIYATTPGVAAEAQRMLCRKPGRAGA
ncbi:MAG: hypothetical protein VB138_14200, partial [Burkholderia sp.]